MTTRNANNLDTHFIESPASWNTKYLSPEGFVCQLTLRAGQGSELLEKVNTALAHLLAVGCTPYQFGNTASALNAARAESQSDRAAWCALHECEMRHWEKNGKTWYSHKVDGKWCSGK